MKLRQFMIGFLFLPSCFGLANSQEWHWLYLYPTPSSVVDFSFLNETTGYILTEPDEVLKTVDGGNKWSNLSMGDNSVLDMLFLNESEGWLLSYKREGWSSYAYMLITSDGGNNRNPVKISSSVSYSYFDDIHDFYFITIKSAGIVEKMEPSNVSWTADSHGSNMEVWNNQKG